MTAPEQRTWRIGEGVELLWRSWDEDEHIVFHVNAGDTHLLNSMAAEALKMLERQPMNLDTLTRQMADLLGVDEQAFPLRSHLAELLVKFDERGLIEPIS